MRVPICPYPHQHIIICLLITGILVEVKWYLKAVLICVSQMANVIEHISSAY